MTARLLGIAQDAGVPHIGCACPRCEAHRAAPLLPACLALQGEKHWLIDATPAFATQLRMLPQRPAGILLTHLHMGHIAGLLQLGPEALATRGWQLHATPRNCAFLTTNAPWKLLAERGHIRLFEHPAGERFSLEPGLEIEAFEVAHRNEYGDTVGYRIFGPKTTLVYLPDIDAWELDLHGLLASCDLALLDGTFFSRDELQHQARVPHPPIEETLALLTQKELAKVRFLHLNHTNPVLDPHGPRPPLVRQGETIPLSRPKPPSGGAPPLAGP